MSSQLLSPSHNIEFDTSVKRFGNAAGMEHASRIEERLASLEQDIILLRPYWDESLAIRQMILDSQSQLRASNSVRHLRNAVAHGSNIQADMYAISSILPIDPGRAETWKSTFSTLYHLNYDVRKDQNMTAAPELIRICNIMATIQLVSLWQDQPTTELNFYGSLCQSLVSGWEEATDNNTATGFWSAAVNKSTYESIINWYHQLGDL